MKVRTRFNADNDYVTCPGTYTCDPKTGAKELGYEYKYKVEYDDNGRRHLIIAGRSDVYNKIQSFKDDVDIYKILGRYFGGDVSVLDKNKSFYLDVSTIPTNFNDFHNKIEEGKNIFGCLPTDFKSLFNNDVNQFVNKIYSKEFESIYNGYLDSKKKPIVNKPLVEESNE